MPASSSRRTTPLERKAKPFLKWVGGKQQLLSQFEPYFPSEFDRYFEPFLGGGAVYFHLWNTHKLPEEIYLFDNNAELVNAYIVVRDNLDSLIALLASHKENHDKHYYYQIRDLDRRGLTLSEIERAARTIYLNKTCYNGLYRVNSKEQFNVPIGSYNNPKILYRDVLEAASLALQGTTIGTRDFRDILDPARPGDFYYFDPPYDPISKTANFTGYTADNFGDEDQQALADLYTRLTEKGCLCMLSNSYTPYIRDLYQSFRIELVSARRAVNSDANGRGNIKEVVVLNY